MSLQCNQAPWKDSFSPNGFLTLEAAQDRAGYHDNRKQVDGRKNLSMIKHGLTSVWSKNPGHLYHGKNHAKVIQIKIGPKSIRLVQNQTCVAYSGLFCWKDPLTSGQVFSWVRTEQGGEKLEESSLLSTTCFLPWLRLKIVCRGDSGTGWHPCRIRTSWKPTESRRPPVVLFLKTCHLPCGRRQRERRCWFLVWVVALLTFNNSRADFDGW